MEQVPSHIKRPLAMEDGRIKGGAALQHPLSILNGKLQHPLSILNGKRKEPGSGFQ